MELQKQYTLTGADGKPYFSKQKGKFGGHRKTKFTAGWIARPPCTQLQKGSM